VSNFNREGWTEVGPDGLAQAAKSALNGLFGLTFDRAMA
jgi:hypothetical protein